MDPAKLEAAEAKRRIRSLIWQLLEKKKVARFPRPITNRIPNFVGAEQAAAKLTEISEFRDARFVKVNPDAPQRSIREAVLVAGKKLLMPTPRLRNGMILLDDSKIPKGKLRVASTIAGAFSLGENVSLHRLPRIDFVVAGSVAVSRMGARVGKGEGYSEIEYAILRELGRVDESTPVATTVHDLQIVGDIPKEDHDIPVDIIATPTTFVRTHTALSRPRGIQWPLVTDEMLRAMPILAELKSARAS